LTRPSSDKVPELSYTEIVAALRRDGWVVAHVLRRVAKEIEDDAGV